jgi:hypothetical protein
MDYSFTGVNHHSLPLAPLNAMQLGHTPYPEFYNALPMPTHVMARRYY